jgi:hypothetical protein
LRHARVDHLRTTLLEAAGIRGAKGPIDLVLATPEGVAVETFGRERA